MANHTSLQAPLVAAVAAAIVASASTAAAQQYEARTVAPPTVEHTRRGELMLGVTGGVLLGLPYGASLWAAAASERDADKLLYFPVVGPWGTLLNRTVCSAPGCRGNLAGDALPLVADGLAQTAGFALIIAALSTPAKPESPPAAATGPTVHIAPASYRGGGGLAAFGTF